MALTNEQMAALMRDIVQKALARQYSEQIVGNPEVVKTYERLYDAAVEISVLWMQQLEDYKNEYTIAINQNFGAIHIKDTSAGLAEGDPSRIVELPETPTAHQVVTVIDAKHTFGAPEGSCKIKGRGKRIMGSSNDFICSTNGMRVELVFIDEQYGWTVSGIYGAVYN